MPRLSRIMPASVVHSAASALRPRPAVPHSSRMSRTSSHVPPTPSVSAPNRKIQSSGRVEKERIPFAARRSIFFRGYLVSPAKRLSR